jgi:serine/threonine-protein kinase RsbW
LQKLTPINTYTKVVKSDPALIPEVNEYLHKIIAATSLSKEKLSNLDLAISEAISNAMVHGNKLDPNKDVTVTLNIYEKRIELKIKDMGKGFKPEDVPDPTKPENIFKDSGRGIYIMNSFIDDVFYNFSDEGTELVLILSTL